MCSFKVKGLDNFGLWIMSIHNRIEVKIEEAECRVVAAPGLLAGDGIVVPPVGDVQLTLYRVSNKYPPDTHKSSDPTLPQYRPLVKTLTQVTILITASEVIIRRGVWR